MFDRLRSEIAKTRAAGLRDRVRDVLELNGVDWKTQSALRDRIAALETAPPPVPSSPPPPPPPEPEPEPAPSPPTPPPVVDHTARDIMVGTTWFAKLPPVALTISVILATRNRAEWLPRAIASVVGQSHEDWELVIVDDASTDATAELLVALDDPRIHVVAGPGRTAAAARNVGLAAATGDVIAYADDDNSMEEHWLAAVAHTFSTRPEVQVAYGACVRPDPAGELMLQFEPWDRLGLLDHNPVDLGALAHRRQLPEAHFDEELVALCDWDLLGRLTRTCDPVRIPIISHTYRVDAPNRLTDRHDPYEYARVRRNVARNRPLRILGFNSLFPLITETYIAEELRSLVPYGAELAFCRLAVPVSPMRIAEPVFNDLEQAVETFRPDVLFLHWALFAGGQLDRLTEIGIPFGVRLHSFDLQPDLVARIRSHPLCIGMWTFPTTNFTGLGDFQLSVMLSSELPPPAAARDLVLSVSAGLPKRDFPMLVDALASVPGDRRIVLGTTNEWTGLPGEVAALCERLDDAPLVQVNLDRAQVHALQARAAVLVYTLGEEHSFGMPMSIVEALCSGCSVIVPDRPEARAFAGPNARGYTTGEDITRHCLEVLAGGPEIEAEHAENLRYGRERFMDPAHGATFHADLLEALARYAARA